ncbi:MAG: hypothetical protein JWM87_3181 [Candidatus Eremiobacteraeota bacterium]|nr:hypothetical protein [Candidatus Eremiobacteraeota bacterium]
MTDQLSISLTVSSSNPFAEIFVVDGAYQLVARGIAYVHADVVPGIFKIKTRLGRSESEEIHLFKTDTTLVVEPPVQVSPIPLRGTNTSHDYQVDAAETHSKNVHVDAGSGAGIFLMARRSCPAPSESTAAAQPARNLAAGMSLRDNNGKMIADFGASSVVEHDAGRDAWAACTVSLNPGQYVLRTNLGGGMAVEQVVFAPAGWQLQLFLLSTSAADDPAPQSAGDDSIDLSVLGNMAVSMVKLGNGFNGSDNTVGQADLVRIALADGRPVFSNAVAGLLDDMLHKKFENPIFGIYGAHLMLMGQKYFARDHDKVGRSLESDSIKWIFDQNLFDQVIRNLRLLLGSSNADVEALSLKCSDPALRATRPADVPPMFRQSWSICVEASNGDPAMLSLALWERIAAMVPAGPFLTWKAEADASEYDTSSSPLGTVKTWFSGLAAQALPLLGAASHSAVYRYAVPSATSPALKAIEAALPPGIRDSLRSDADRQRLAVELDVPRAAIDSVLGPNRST